MFSLVRVASSEEW